MIVGFDIDLAKSLVPNKCRQNVLFTNHAFDSLIPVTEIQRNMTP